MEDRIVAQAHNELEQMLDILTNSFTTMRDLLERSGNRRNDLTRRIQEVNVEFTRFRANGMRNSFERNLARQEEERRMRRRTDSDSSTDSNDSDFDLDFIYPVDLWQFSSPSASGDSNASRNMATSSPPESQTSVQQTADTIAASTSTPPSTTSNITPSRPTTSEQSNTIKRKTAFEKEDAPPAKRSMATSTDDAYFSKF
ncbi:DASH complex subunit DAM1 [Caenorhabditis elegans]|uniref:DASH complex subunit DAM1 n=1 Tax=Caenorhabditis elegans TaxID=6239 RepID=A8WFN7_CAEEL|nr:DASH complex subunit DAM1 [Caenorhabditis elegans]CCD63473.1 DASH complex subunit DAM1 [Caenorhabditis elegans]|eukprot:NP_001123106.1 Uncharacterized protein CELE_C14A11.9 [Caenorhabditis elegans]